MKPWFKSFSLGIPFPFSPHYLGQYNETGEKVKSALSAILSPFSPHYLGQYNETYLQVDRARSLDELSVPITWVNTMKLKAIFAGLLEKFLSVPITWVNTMKQYKWKNRFKPK